MPVSSITIHLGFKDWGLGIWCVWCIAFLQYLLAACCSMLLCVAVALESVAFFGYLQCVAVRCIALHCVAVTLESIVFLGHMVALCCSVLQRVAARCSVSQWVAMFCSVLSWPWRALRSWVTLERVAFVGHLWCLAMIYSMLQFAAVMMESIAFIG